VDRARRPVADAALGLTRLLAAAQRGDEYAFVQLTSPHRRALHVHAYRMLGNLHDADDALQETLLRAWRGLRGYEPRALADHLVAPHRHQRRAADARAAQAGRIARRASAAVPRPLPRRIALA
jgi:DNA-directed RNA polymerase specialized sigma24 family protein